MTHIECIAQKGAKTKKVYLPKEVAILGRDIRIQKEAGWKIVRVIGKEPEFPPLPLEEGSLDPDLH